jgi:hypothetical protein
MRTREPSCNVAAAGAGDGAAVFAEGAGSPRDCAIGAADVSEASTVPVVLQLATSKGEGEVRTAVDSDCKAARELPDTSNTAVNFKPSTATDEASAASLRRMWPGLVNQKSISGARGCHPTFHHQLKRQRVAAHALRRETKQPLNVSHRAICRRLDNNHAAAMADRASNRHFDCGRFNNGARSVRNWRRLLHLKVVIET